MKNVTYASLIGSMVLIVMCPLGSMIFKNLRKQECALASNRMNEYRAEEKRRIQIYLKDNPTDEFLDHFLNYPLLTRQDADAYFSFKNDGLL